MLNRLWTLVGLAACVGYLSGAVPRGNLAALFGRIWQVTASPSPAAAGSLYIFLPNGTLLMASCVETYRIATWSLDPKTPNVLRVFEDGAPTYTLAVVKVSSTSLQVKQTLVRSKDVKQLTLKAREKEFICPNE